MKDVLYTVLEKFAQDTLAQHSGQNLRASYKELQSFYEAKKQQRSLAHSSFTSVLQRLTYVICRMPATYAVIDATFKNLIVDQLMYPKTFLDLGCGSGAGLWAAWHHWPSLTELTAIDQDSIIIQYAQQLLAQSKLTFPTIDWKTQKIAPPVKNHDIILLSYVLNEDTYCLTDFLPLVWEKCNNYLIIIEPGTPRGFQQCLQMRQILIDQGAFIIAPCGHQNRCPLQSKQDWCHFEQSVNRLDVHRFIKEATLGYENEAYSYLVASRTPLESFQPRIIRPPLKPKGQILVDVCTPKGLERLTLTKRHASYKDKKTLRWGKKISIKN